MAALVAGAEASAVAAAAAAAAAGRRRSVVAISSGGRGGSVVPAAGRGAHRKSRRLSSGRDRASARAVTCHGTQPHTQPMQPRRLADVLGATAGSACSWGIRHSCRGRDPRGSHSGGPRCGARALRPLPYTPRGARCATGSLAGLEGRAAFTVPHTAGVAATVAVQYCIVPDAILDQRRLKWITRIVDSSLFAHCFFSPRTPLPRYIAEQGINIHAGSSREDASFGASCARRLEKKGQ